MVGCKTCGKDFPTGQIIPDPRKTKPSGPTHCGGHRPALWAPGLIRSRRLQAGSGLVPTPRASGYLLSALFIPLLFACGSSTAGSGTPTPTATTVPTASARPAIIGFGATDASWNAHHTADSDFAPGAAYDPDTNLPKINGHTGARYVATNHSNGRVLGYMMNLMPGTAVDGAKASVLQEFPSDALVMWFAVKDSCAQLEVKSAILGAVLSDPKIGDPDGMALVELDTVHSDGSASYDPNNINEAILLLGSETTTSDAPAC